jgi:hypothetical protein
VIAGKLLLGMVQPTGEKTCETHLGQLLVAKSNTSIKGRFSTKAESLKLKMPVKVGKRKAK